MHRRVCLSLGSNIGRRVENIRRAFGLLGELLIDARISRLYETEPKYFEEQPRFLNAVVVGSTSMGACELLERLQNIEAELGRKRTEEIPNGPRSIDIDILLFGETTRRTAKLTIPHPGLPERKFVLVPLLEVEPTAKHPATGVPYWKALYSLPSQGVYYGSFR